MSGLALFIATAGPTGYVRFAPGTAGSAIGLAVYLAMHALGFGIATEVGVTVVTVVIGTWAGAAAARHFQQDDPSPVVIDEVAGQLVTLAATGAGLRGAVLGFLVFRALDVIKPWPSGRLERLHGGVGIMADDVAAAIYGNLILRAAFLGVPGLI